MTDFLTVEDINGIVFNNQDCYWYTIDIADITDGTEDLNEVKIDFCKVTRTKTEQGYEFFVKVDNSNWIGYDYSVSTTRFVSVPIARNGGLVFITPETIPTLKLYLYLGSQEWLGFTQKEILNPILDLYLNELAEEQTIVGKDWQIGGTTTVSLVLNQGYNNIMKSITHWGYVLVNLLKTDFQFNCTDNIYLGKVNTVKLGANADYKPQGDLIGEYIPHITIEYNGKTLPVTWDNTLNDYTFQLDLINTSYESKIKFNVNVEANKVLNHTLTEVTLIPSIETITTFNQLKAICTNGGVAKIGASIQFTNDITVENDVTIITENASTLYLNHHKIIVNPQITFIGKNNNFIEGSPAIYQKKDSIVELTKCAFTHCEGIGSCIKCDIDLESLHNPSDFTTVLNECVFADNNLCILHSGDLTVNKCRTDTYLVYDNNHTNINISKGNNHKLNDLFNKKPSTIWLLHGLR